MADELEEDRAVAIADDLEEDGAAAGKLDEDVAVAMVNRRRTGPQRTSWTRTWPWPWRTSGRRKGPRWTISRRTWPWPWRSG